MILKMFGAWDHGSATYYLDTTGFYESSQANEGEAEIKKEEYLILAPAIHEMCAWLDPS